MKISTRARYALRFMIDLADHSSEDKPVILRDIAERQQVSKRYLEQLATALKHANLVSVTSGRGGGYNLRRPAEEIKVGEIIEATIGEINVVECVLRDDSCPRVPECRSRRMWTRLNDQINETFNSYTLSDLCEPKSSEKSGRLVS